MDASTKWIIGIGIATAIGTWALAGVTWWLAKRTGDMAKATAESVRLSAESFERSILLQELAVITPLAASYNYPGRKDARARREALMARLGFHEETTSEPVDADFRAK